jgi:hypothetical protein
VPVDRLFHVVHRCPCVSIALERVVPWYSSGRGGTRANETRSETTTGPGLLGSQGNEASPDVCKSLLVPARSLLISGGWEREPRRRCDTSADPRSGRSPEPTASSPPFAPASRRGPRRHRDRERAGLLATLHRDDQAQVAVERRAVHRQAPPLAEALHQCGQGVDPLLSALTRTVHCRGCEICWYVDHDPDRARTLLARPPTGATNRL